VICTLPSLSVGFVGSQFDPRYAGRSGACSCSRSTTQGIIMAYDNQLLLMLTATPPPPHTHTHTRTHTHTHPRACVPALGHCRRHRHELGCKTFYPALCSGDRNTCGIKRLQPVLGFARRQQLSLEADWRNMCICYRSTLNCAPNHAASQAASWLFCLLTFPF
jgi:hypothetical protein